jgi:hypothetical protein
MTTEQPTEEEQALIDAKFMNAELRRAAGIGPSVPPLPNQRDAGMNLAIRRVAGRVATPDTNKEQP